MGSHTNVVGRHRLRLGQEAKHKSLDWHVLHRLRIRQRSDRREQVIAGLVDGIVNTTILLHRSHTKVIDIGIVLLLQQAGEVGQQSLFTAVLHKETAIDMGVKKMTTSNTVISTHTIDALLTITFTTTFGMNQRSGPIEMLLDGVLLIQR